MNATSSSPSTGSCSTPSPKVPPRPPAPPFWHISTTHGARFSQFSCTRRPQVVTIAPMHGNQVPDSYVYVTEEGVARHYADGSVEALAWEDVVEVRVDGGADSEVNY